MAVNMQESKVTRFGTVCAQYFAQGVPWFFVAKGFGAMFAVLGLSRVLNDSGFHAALRR